MAATVVLHAPRGGTGRSTLLANLALLAAAAGRRVGLVDTDIQSPSLDTLFGVDPRGCSLTDYLLGRCEIEEAAHPVGPAGGSLLLVPARTATSSLADILAAGYDVGLLPEGFRRLAAVRNLDLLLLDTHAGLNNEAVTALAAADLLVFAVRPDPADLSGAAETAALACRVPARRAVVLTMVPEGVRTRAARRRAEAAYRAPSVGTLPYSAELAALGGRRIFAEARPAHPVTAEIGRIAAALGLLAPPRAASPPPGAADGGAHAAERASPEPDSSAPDSPTRDSPARDSPDGHSPEYRSPPREPVPSTAAQSADAPESADAKADPAARRTPPNHGNG